MMVDFLLSDVLNVQVSDTTAAQSSNAVGQQINSTQMRTDQF
jgi:hypothetical protein